MSAVLRLGDILVQKGIITTEQIEKAMQEEKEKGGSRRLGELLVAEGLVSQEQVLQALSQRLNLDIIDLDNINIDIEAVELIPQNFCVKYKAIAYSKQGMLVNIAVADPLDLYGIEDIKTLINGVCNIQIATEEQIMSEINKAYASINAQKAANKVSETIEKEETIVSIANEESDSPVINLINSIILKAHSEGSSDVHFEPFEHCIKIRLRIDGELMDHMEIDEVLGPQVATRIKIIAGLDIAEKRLPQDGNFKLSIGKENISVRVSSMPTVYGEKLVLRFLSQAKELDHSDQYGMNDENFKKINRILKNPYGIVLITGPTGSGKTTTLYMMIEKMAKKNINISTIEDPVEKNIERVNQTQVNPQAGLTFDTGLRALLRQDPDVILVGETRDSETASVAVSAALTGHLVFSTLHTNDAIRAIIRLEDMGIESYMIANSLVGVVAQRLVRKICVHCKEVYKPTEDELLFLPKGIKLFKGKGCIQCNNTGYRGRTAVHEILEIDSKMRKMISAKEPVAKLYEHATKEGGLRLLASHIMELVNNGETTLEEFFKQAAFSGSTKSIK